MSNVIWLLIALIGVAVVLVGAYLFRGNLGKNKTNHRDPFLPLGITFMAIGFGAGTPALWVLGIVFLAIGTINRRGPKAEPADHHKKTEHDRRMDRKSA